MHQNYSNFVTPTNFELLPFCLFRLVLVAVLVVQKCYNDVFYNNQTIAYIGGIQLEELNALEIAFLDTLDFDILIREDEFSEYRAKLATFFGRPPDASRLQEIRDFMS